MKRLKGIIYLITWLMLANPQAYSEDDSVVSMQLDTYPGFTRSEDNFSQHLSIDIIKHQAFVKREGRGVAANKSCEDSFSFDDNDVLVTHFIDLFKNHPLKYTIEMAGGICDCGTTVLSFGKKSGKSLYFYLKGQNCNCGPARSINKLLVPVEPYTSFLKERVQSHFHDCTLNNSSL
jgi:hypothetical protein